jgi:hypothetical protein
MARIKIDDLPAAENLTPEQEELIQGAGPRSFRPTPEGLASGRIEERHDPVLAPALRQRIQ